MDSSADHFFWRLRGPFRKALFLMLFPAVLLGIGACDITSPEEDAGVMIADPYLEAQIRNAVDRPEGVLTPADFQGLRRLVAQGSSSGRVTSLEGLQHATDLEVLIVGQNEIQDLSPLEGLEQLQTLALEGNQAQDLVAIGGLSELRHLLLDGNPLQDLSPVREMSQLRWLTARNTQVSDLEPLVGHSFLTYLDVGGTRVADLPPLADLPSLKGLILDGNQVTSLSPLAGLPGLRALGLAHNGIEDAGPLLDLSALELVGIQGNPWTDQALCAVLPSVEARGAVVVPRPNCPDEPGEPAPGLVTLTRSVFVVSIDPSSPDVEPSRARVTLEFALENGTESSLFLPDCGVLRPPLIERQVDGEWELAFQPTFILCGGEREIAPGESAGRSWIVVGEDTEGRTLLSDSQLRPGRITGPFRLDWDAWATASGADLPGEATRSQPFYFLVPPV